MQCPYCGESMEQGYVQSTHGFFWIEKPIRFIGLDIRRRGQAEALGQTDLIEGRRLLAYRCRACHKLIADV